MLRKTLVALTMGALCAGSALAGDAPASAASEKTAATEKKAATGIVGWFKNRAASGSDRKNNSGGALTDRMKANASGKPSARVSRAPAPATSGIERAVIADAERQAVPVRQTSGAPQDSAEFVHEQSALPPQPVEIQQAPVLPNISATTGPQYFSATPVGMSSAIPVHPSGNWQTYQAPVPTDTSSSGPFWNASSSVAASGPQYVGSAPMMTYGSGGTYPQTGAALYPAPRPGIPQQMGGALIQNQAFHPHEMLYPHRYKAIYPPYYYKVNGGWMVTPFGVWSKEHWHLQGTQVDVKYKSHISPFAHFTPPVWR